MVHHPDARFLAYISHRAVNMLPGVVGANPGCPCQADGVDLATGLRVVDPVALGMGADIETWLG